MLHTIKNKYLQCSIASQGAEIRSLIDRQKAREYIWQIKPNIWNSSSPVLFPAIGNIKGGQIIYKGQAYPLPKHGIIRHREELEFKKYNEQHLAFSLKSSPATAALYPFDFHFSVHYQLIGRQLEMRYQIENHGEEWMPFNCGGHTAYALSLDGDKSLSDYFLDFTKESQFLKARTLNDNGLLGDEIREIALKEGRLFLSEGLFKRDAFILEAAGLDSLGLGHKTKGVELSLHFADYPHLALWAKPGADFVCIEPWLGLPDHQEESLQIMEKANYRHLAPGDSFEISIITALQY